MAIAIAFGVMATVDEGSAFAGVPATDVVLPGGHAAGNAQSSAMRWPGRRITYYNGAKRWKGAIDKAAGLWNRARVGIRFRRVRSRRAQVRVVEVPAGALGSNVAGRAQLGYGPYGQAKLWIERGLSPSWALVTALHEWGHILGLGHRRARVCAVMVPGESTGCPQSGPEPWLRPCRLIQRDDVRRAAAVYGGRWRLEKPFCAFQPYFSGVYDFSYEADALIIEAGPRMTGLAARIGPVCNTGAVQTTSERALGLALPPGDSCVTFWGVYPRGNRSRAVTQRYRRLAGDPPPTGPPPRPLDEDFETPIDGRWLSAPAGRWQRTSEAANSGGYSVSESPGTSYPDNSDTTLLLGRSIALGGRSGCSLVWHVRYQTEVGFDYLVMEMRRSPAEAWTEVGPHVTGTSGGSFETFFTDLAAFEGSSSTELRMRFFSDGSIVDQGVEVDDVYIHCDA